MDKMKQKLLIGCSALVVLIVFIGLIASVQPAASQKFDISYRFDGRSSLSYNVNQFDVTNDDNLTANVSMYVTDTGDERITCMISTDIYNGSSSDILYSPSFNNTIDSRGHRLEKIQNTIPEIRFDLPGQIAYPENGIAISQSWSYAIGEANSLALPDQSIDYDISGTCRYTLVDTAMVSVRAGDYYCLYIECEVEYRLNLEINSSAGITYSTLDSSYHGRYYIDNDTSICVKWSGESEGVLSTDATEIVRNIGICNSYIEEKPVVIHVNGELIGVSR